jgi:chitodextrinase
MKKNKSLIAIAISLFLVATPLAAMNAFALTDTTPPSIPTNVHAALNAGNQVFLLWNASTDNNGVVGYTIIKNSSILANTPGTSYVDTAVIPNTNYTYSVLAFDAAGNVSASSAPISITTLVSGDTSSPTAPTSLSATSTSANLVNLNWATSTDNIAVTGYMIIRNGLVIANSASTSFADTTVMPNTSYSYSVLAYDAAGNVSAQSNSVTITTPTSIADTTSPSTPTNLTATSTSPNQIKLNWATSTDNVAVIGYNIYRNGNLIGTSTAPKFTDTGLATSTSYTYNVKSYDAAGNTSALSNTVIATTLSTKNNPGHKDDEKENKDDHEDKGKHLGQKKEHTNNGNHFGQNKDQKDNGNHLGQKKDR